MADFWEKAAHSLNRMFSLLRLFVAFVVSQVLVASVPGHCLPFTF